MGSANTDYNTFICRDKYYNSCKQSLDEKNRELQKYIVTYIDQNHEVLLNSGLYQLYWNTAKNNFRDSEILYESINMTADEIGNMITESGVNKSSWKVFNKPHNWTFVIILKYFHDKKDMQGLYLSLLFLSCSLYATLFFKYFRFPPQENIMAYTVNNLTNRHDLKREGSLIKVLEKISKGCYDKYKSYLSSTNFSDRHIVEFVMNLNTRLNNFIKVIKAEYEKNRANKKYLNYDTDSNEEEDFRENTNQSYQITTLTENITNKIIVSKVNQSLIQTVSKITTVSQSQIDNTMSSIINKSVEKLKRFISNFLQQYLVTEKLPMESFSSKSYLTYINKIYSKSNVSETYCIK